MDVGKSFTFMFQDPDWLRKLGIATLVAMIGVILSPVLIGIVPLLIFIGYTLQVMRNVRDGHERPLPEWDDWEGFLRQGFKLAVVYFVWSLPIAIVTLPASLFAGLLDSRGGDGVQAIGVMMSICASCLSVLWWLVLALFSPAIYARVARYDTIAAGFDFAALWAFTRNNISNVIVSLLMLLVAYIIGSIVAPLGVIAIVIGLLVTVPFGLVVFPWLVEAHLFGQVAAQSTTVSD